MEYQIEGNCYVLLDGLHEEVTELVMKHRHDIIIYPERSMRLVDLASYRPYVKSVLTESPWIIGTYDRRKVWLYREGKWVHPEIQTFGTSREFITSDILGIDCSIPLSVAGGLKEFNKDFAYPSKFYNEKT